MANRLPQRRSMRLRDFDYSQAGVYFVTVSTRFRGDILGQVHDGQTVLNYAGDIVQSQWAQLPQYFAGVELDEFVVMPDHVHGVVVLLGTAGAMNRAPTLGEVVRSFKAASTRKLRVGGYFHFAWQRNYYEHVVRSEPELQRIREYVRFNALKEYTT